MTKDEEERALRLKRLAPEQEKIVQAQPDYGPALCVLGLIDAALARKNWPWTKAVERSRSCRWKKIPSMAAASSDLFRDYSSLGGREGSCLAATGTGRCSRRILMLSYGALKLLPFWDPLRGDPRFEKIVASLAPKKNKSAPMAEEKKQSYDWRSRTSSSSTLSVTPSCSLMQQSELLSELNEIVSGTKNFVRPTAAGN